MGLENLKEEIIRDAKEEALAILAPAKKEAARLIAEAKRKAESLRIQKQEDTRKAGEFIRKQEKAKIEIVRKKKILETRKSLVDDCFALALSRMQSSDEKKRALVLATLVNRAEREIEIASISVRKEDFSLIKKYPVTIIKSDGGIIAENKDKSLLVDLSFGAIFAGIREKHLQKVNQILFEEE